MRLKRPYATIDEFYKAVESLIATLNASGKKSEANSLDIILQGVWTTGSELIGELALAMEAMHTDLPKDIRTMKDNCLYFAKHHRRILGLD